MCGNLSRLLTTSRYSTLLLPLPSLQLGVSLLLYWRWSQQCSLGSGGEYDFWINCFKAPLKHKVYQKLLLMPTYEFDQKVIFIDLNGTIPKLWHQTQKIKLQEHNDIPKWQKILKNATKIPRRINCQFKLFEALSYKAYSEWFGGRKLWSRLAEPFQEIKYQLPKLSLKKKMDKWPLNPSTLVHTKWS